MTNPRDDLMALVTALQNADWPDVSIGNKALIRNAIERLTEAASRPATQVVDREPVAWRLRTTSGSNHNYCHVVTDGELEIWKHNWASHLAQGTAVLEPLYTHPPKSPDTSAAVIQSHALKQALDCLSEIAGAHIPDCPAHYAGEELDWAQRHVGSLRLKAEIARDGIAAAIRQLPTSKD